MTKIYKVLSNIKHDGEDIKKDTFIEEFAGAGTLAAEGILLEIEGAESVAEAKDIDAERMANAEAEATGEEEQAPADTWGPQKDEEEVPEEETPEEKEEEADEEEPEEVDEGEEEKSDNQ